MHIFESTLSNQQRLASSMYTYKNLVEEVLDKLLLKRPGCKQAMQIRPEEFCDKVAVHT